MRTNIEPTLFDMGTPIPTGTTRNPRQAQIDTASAKANTVVIEQYKAILNGFRGRIFGPWEVTEAYENRYGELSLTNKRALGSLFQGKRHSGEIVVTGLGKRPNGNEAATYRFVN